MGHAFCQQLAQDIGRPAKVRNAPHSEAQVSERYDLCQDSANIQPVKMQPKQQWYCNQKSTGKENVIGGSHDVETRMGLQICKVIFVHELQDQKAGHAKESYSYFVARVGCKKYSKEYQPQGQVNPDPCDKGRSFDLTGAQLIIIFLIIGNQIPHR